MSAAHRRPIGTSDSCPSINSALLSPRMVMFLLAVIGCVVGTLVAQADIGNTPIAPASHPWGMSLDHFDESLTTQQLYEVRLRVEPTDCLIIANVDPHSRNHSVTVEWQPARSGHQLRWPPTSPNVVIRNAAPAEPAPESRDSVRTLTKEKLESDEGLDRAPASDIGAVTRMFRAPFSTPGLGRRTGISERACLATCIAEIDGVRIFCEDPSFSAMAARRIAGTIADSIRPQVECRIGSISDLDQDGSLTVVLTQLNSSQSAESHPLLGCVRPADFISVGSTSGDIIYLDPRIVESRASDAVLAHELAHAAVFSRIRELMDSGVRSEMLPAWLNEAVAHACERAMFPRSPNLAARIDSWTRDTGRWPLIPADHLGSAVSARGPERAAGVLFVEFLQQTQSLCELVDSAALQTDDRLVRTSEAFALTFRDWTVWMAERYDSEICQSTGKGKKTLLIRGTAARWLRPEISCDVTVCAESGCELQVTLLKSLPKPDIGGSLQLTQIASE